MEFVLLGLLVLSFPIIAIVALVKAVNLNERLRAMEARFGALELKVGSLLSAAPAPAATRPAAASPPEAASPQATHGVVRASRLLSGRARGAFAKKPWLPDAWLPRNFSQIFFQAEGTGGLSAS